MTCRLPQTPKTPTAAAAHYFDDIWAPSGKPKKPNHLRRSSTARSIGHRSDWESTNDDEEDLAPINRTNSIGYLNEDALKRKAEVDKHVAHYVSDQLNRLNGEDTTPLDHGELEASLDGSSDEKRSGEKNGGDYFNEKQ
jgi:hypothetical protein